MKKEPTENKDLVSRKEALKKMGKYAALTAMGTFMILNPKKAQAQSGPPDPGGGGGLWD
ncbi:hypothetical protein N9Q03_01725 [Flavobacteriaceae bacterium]|jgi:hypothetical protein|nr:hypothetical protein [Flavobacteriaceae bacterium]|tara:strand:+ start:163 stop:339 length:177 start_codon:yes stop_codon:yes gene_type:complete